MNIILWVITGAVIGWLMTYLFQDRGIKPLLANIFLGIVGALTGGYLLTPMFDASKLHQSNFSFLALLFSIGGAVILLSVVHFFRRKSTMNDIDIHAKWSQVRGKICTRWNKLTEEDVQQINGDHDRFINVLQDRYGYDDKQAEEDLQSYLRAVS